MLELRASKIGGCVRAYVLDLRSAGDGPEVLTPRQKLYFDVGKTLEPVIMSAAGLDPALLYNDLVAVRVHAAPGLTLVGHPDSADDEYVIECKTMRSMPFKKMIRNGMQSQFPQYLIQGSVYCKGMEKKGVRYIALDKDASEIHQVVFLWDSLEPYWKKAIYNGLMIQHWVGKKKLPTRDPELPSWYCLEAYCRHHTCRFSMAKRRKSPLKMIKVKNGNGWDGISF